MSPAPARVVFACVHSAGRSQMASAWFNAIADPAKACADAAGTQPAARPHPEVVVAMRELGLDVSRRAPQLLTAELAAGAVLMVTMGCGEQCPYVPGVARDDWPLEDPKGKAPDVVRRIRDDLRRRVDALVGARGWRAPRPEAARGEDLAAVIALVRASGLPTEGVADAFPAGYQVVRVDGRLVAVAGVEVHGSCGLLRSVAVDEAARGHGLGAALVRSQLERASAAGLASVFLLTTTAADYFQRLGFAPVSRVGVPAELRASAEFAAVCPASAACLEWRGLTS